MSQEVEFNVFNKERIYTALKCLIVASISVGAALLIDFAIDIYLYERPPGRFDQTCVALYIAAVLISGLYRGFWCGILALFIENALNLFLSWNTHFALASNIHGAERVVVVSLISCAVAWLAGRNRERQKVLRQFNRDLEERVAQRTTELERSNCRLEAFCYSLAHDLRAPLRAMQGFSQALLEDHGEKMDEGGRVYAKHIQTSSQAMGELIQDLLAYTELDKAEIHLSEIDLETVARRVVRTYAAEIHVRNAAVSIDNELPRVYGNAATAELVIVNLLSNALKFTNVHPQIRIRAEDRPHSTVLWVEDNGIGIDPAYHERIFGVFQRLHGRDTYEGNGIGLALCKRAVEQMGGLIGVQSEPGKGSRFWVEWQKPSADTSPRTVKPVGFKEMPA